MGAFERKFQRMEQDLKMKKSDNPSEDWQRLHDMYQQREELNRQIYELERRVYIIKPTAYWTEKKQGVRY